MTDRHIISCFKVISEAFKAVSPKNHPLRHAGNTPHSVKF
jgi:hypothetical protein